MSNFGMSEDRYRHIVKYTADFSVDLDTGVVTSPKGTNGFYDKTGYLRFNVKGKNIKVHQIVSQRMFGEDCIGMQVNHKDGNKLNNRGSNIELSTLKENVRHAWATGLNTNIGETSPKAKLTEDLVRYIRSNNKVSTELARELGVSPRTIRGVRKRETWKHVI